MLRVVNLDAEHGMWADHSALAALNTDLRIPLRNLERDIALFPFRGAGREGSIHWERAHRDLIAVAGVDYAEHLALKLGRLRRERGGQFDFASDFLRHADF